MAEDLATAPLYEDVAEGPPGGAAYWLQAADGVRIRAAMWAEAGARGTILMFPGRTEYIEKYGRLAGDFRRAGYAMACIDWRGQGLADRAAAPRDLGHVGSFEEYQNDVAALVRGLQALGAPRPWHLVAHSMGGAIGLRALYGSGLDVAGVVFSAPMWGISLSAIGRLSAAILGLVAGPFGVRTRFAPSTGPAKVIPFDGNRLTTDRGQFEYMERQTATHPDLALGGPSIGWLTAALTETAVLMAMPAPPRPALTFLGSEEKIVVKPAIIRRMETWPGGVLQEIPGARHEVLMEAPETRDALIARALGWFDASAR